MGANGRPRAGVTSSRHDISIESQLLAIGSGFVVFVMLSALFVAIQQRRKRRNSRDSLGSPLIPTVAVKPTYLKGDIRMGRQSISPALSPSSGSSGSPQCTPMTPYSSFVEHESILVANQVQPVSELSNERGSISFSVNYDVQTEVLQLSILACHNLPNVINAQGQSILNPYVKLRVLPDNQHRVKTRVLRGTQNPFYDEQFTLYGINKNTLDSYTLHLAVLGSDRYSRDTVIGEVFYKLNECASHGTNEKQNLELQLKPRPTYRNLKTEVLVSMAFNPQANSFNLAILKMKDLPNNEETGLIDSYARVYLLLDGQRISKQKTHVKKKSSEPVFNESFSFDIPSILGQHGGQLRSPQDILESMSFEIIVLNHDGVTRNEVVGQCFISPQSQHWQAMCEQPGQQIAEWHRISAF